MHAAYDSPKRQLQSHAVHALNATMCKPARINRKTADQLQIPSVRFSHVGEEYHVLIGIVAQALEHVSGEGVLKLL